VKTAYRVNPLRSGDPARLGDYPLVGRLGAGGMGTVYLAERDDGGHVAIKVIHAALGADPEFAARFRGEVERARQVPPYCTARFLDADLGHEPPYLVVEYIDGPSLTEVVAERGPLPAGALHSLAVGVATALAGIHGAGVIHRDLKPDNVLLPPGSTKVIDFGLARPFESHSRLTGTDVMVGTVSYMAPERMSGQPRQAVTAAADVFSWGCVVAYAGTGRTPFHGDSASATVGRILSQPPDLDGLPEPLRDPVRRALSKDPADRPTAPELLNLLMGTPAALTSNDSDPPAGVTERPGRAGRSRWRSRPVRVGAVVAAVAVLLGAGAVGYVVEHDRGGRHAPKASGIAAGTGRTPSPSPSASPTPSPRRDVPGQARPEGGRTAASATPKQPAGTPSVGIVTTNVGRTGAITGPGPANKCVDVDTNTPTSGNKVQLWTCNGVAGQQWTLTSAGTLSVFGKCLDITGDSTADNALLELWDCNGNGGQQWRQRSDGSFYNPRSGRCLDDPAGNTTDGTQLQIWDCNTLWPQTWHFQ
jgi:serine/threonine protein kinase